MSLRMCVCVLILCVHVSLRCQACVLTRVCVSLRTELILLYLFQVTCGKDVQNSTPRKKSKSRKKKRRRATPPQQKIKEIAQKTRALQEAKTLRAMRARAKEIARKTREGASYPTGVESALAPSAAAELVQEEVHESQKNNPRKKKKPANKPKRKKSQTKGNKKKPRRK